MKRCSQCGGQFGLIRHRWFGVQYCKRRCYDIAPGLFGDDDEGYGTVLRDGVVPPGQVPEARLAAANCPERAVGLLEGA